MNLTIEEQNKQLEEIQRARELGILPWSHLSNPTQRFEVARDTLDFLLSLLNQTSGLADKRHDDLWEARRQRDEVARRLSQVEQERDRMKEALSEIAIKKYDVWAFGECQGLAKRALEKP